MKRIGFIHEKREIKFLILFAMRFLPVPVNENVLLEICLIDDAFGYLEFAEAFSELAESGHVRHSDENPEKRYIITGKGRGASEVFERQLPSSVREKAQHAALRALFQIRRAAGIHTARQPEPDGLYSVTLSLGDQNDRIMDLKLTAFNEAQCLMLTRNFEQHAEKIYHAILNALLAGYEEEAGSP